MLIEQFSYSNRWRRVHPAVKSVFTLCGIIAGFLTHSPTTAIVMALIQVTITWLGAGTPLKSYLRVSAAPLLFLLVSGITLAVSVTHYLHDRDQGPLVGSERPLKL